MNPARYRPRVHLFVCANARDPNDPLGGGCGPRGERVFRALKEAVRSKGLVTSVWITRTACLGLCPKTGCAVTIAPSMEYLVDVEETEALALLDSAIR
jgi:predicted metal-binding protein